MEQDLASILISEPAIGQRNRELGNQLAETYHALPLTVVIISNGALMFAADLVRHLPLPLQLDVISAHSYVGTQSSRRVTLRSGLRVDVRQRHVLVVDDIFDSGLTLSTIVDELVGAGPADIKTCVLLRKRRPNQASLEPDYVGFTIDDLFVVGYGLDYNEHYRNLPYIGVLHPHLYTD